MRRSLALVPLLAACTLPPTSVVEVPDAPDPTVCGRVRGTSSIMLYQDGGTTVRTPLEAPEDSDVGSAVVPLWDELQRNWLGVARGRVLRSEDAGCTWSQIGALAASGDWAVRSVRTDEGVRLWAFDRQSGATATSADEGRSWEAHDAEEPFVVVPVVSAADPQMLRGVQSRGVVTSTDGGLTWTVTGALPDGVMFPSGGDVRALDPEALLLAAPGGAWASADGGTTWTSLFDDGDAFSAAWHPTDPDARWLVARGEDFLLGIWAWMPNDTDPRGGTWSRVLDELQLPVDPAMRVWPLPDDPAGALSSFGPTTNDAGEPAGNLYLLRTDAGTRTIRVGTFTRIHDLAFRDDRWLAAVEGQAE
jgi:hypothetical protein